jgi:hypothetical protein
MEDSYFTLLTRAVKKGYFCTVEFSLQGMFSTQERTK